MGGDGYKEPRPLGRGGAHPLAHARGSDLMSSPHIEAPSPPARRADTASARRTPPADAIPQGHSSPGTAAPALPLAQAIARWGNWFNQELFGRPTTLPWALRVSAEKAAEAGYPAGTTFHPTFLYESLGNFALCALLLFVVEPKVKLRPGALMAVYLCGYSLLRFGVESMRIDPANHILGLRVNTWVSGIVFVGAALYLAITARRPLPVPPEPDPSS